MRWLRSSMPPESIAACLGLVLAGCGPSRDVFRSMDAGLDASLFDTGVDAPRPDASAVRSCEEGISLMQDGFPCSLGEGLLCSVQVNDCHVSDGYCNGGVFEIRDRTRCGCVTDADCGPFSFCEASNCIACTTTTDPNVACPECGGQVLFRSRNGCVTDCVCGLAECDPSAPADACGPGSRCAVSPRCLSGCSPESRGCCPAACVEDSCPGDLPIGCEMPCPSTDACGGSTCSATRCSCSGGRWLCEAAGCGSPLPGCPPLSCDLRVTFDCSGSVSRNDFPACGSSSLELHVVGQLRSTEGTVEVIVDRPGSVVFLGLVSAAATHWNVTVRDPRTRLGWVVLDGEGASTVTAPDDVSILNRTGPTPDFACAFEWPGSPPCESPPLVRDLTSVLAISSATSFTGCEEGRRFVIGTNP